ncbi:MAG TPA: trypsin-like peptidase domain-containing protein, partial [Kineosporiaceae bacterium]|nr:trypsin-like peptidase domain-containing protein [Kineosporiaceae bacterium]
PAQTYPGQAYPGQTYPAQTYPGQAYPGQGYPAAAYSGQGYGQPYGQQAYGTPQTSPGSNVTQQLPSTDPAQGTAGGSAQNATPGGPWTPPPGGPGATSTRQREPRRPGWGGVTAIGIGAAVLSSLLTAGAMSATGNNGTTSGGSTTTFSQSGAGAQVNPPVSSSSNANPDWPAVANAVEPSVVSVMVSGQGGSGEGSGVILDAQGHVLTNNHVVADASGGGSIMVVLHDGRLYKATIVGTDASTDLAVLQVSSAPSNLKPATLGDSAAVKVGDQVMAAGNPLGLSDTVTTGIVSAINRPVSTQASGGGSPFGGGQSSGEAVVTNAIQTDASINPGNSGGALVDAQGRVIGITSSIASLGSAFGSSQSGSIGLGFAIPINEAKDVASQLIGGGKAQHAWLGITLTQDTVKVDGAQRQAAILQSVAAGTPADKAGLKSGDAVIAVNGVPVSGANSLVAQIRQFRPGTKVTLTVVRNGSSQQIDVTLGTRPNGQ